MKRCLCFPSKNTYTYTNTQTSICLSFIGIITKSDLNKKMIFLSSFLLKVFNKMRSSQLRKTWFSSPPFSFLSDPFFFSFFPIFNVRANHSKTSYLLVECSIVPSSALIYCCPGCGGAVGGDHCPVYIPPINMDPDKREEITLLAHVDQLSRLGNEIMRTMGPFTTH